MFKKTLKRFTTTLILIILIFNFLYTNFQPVYAGDIGEEIIGTITGLLGGVVGVLTWPKRLIAMGLGLGIQFVTTQLAYIDGVTAGETASISERLLITPFEIFFNKVQLLDVNFLDVDVGDSTTQTIRKSVAQWYYVMRLIATAILLLILIYTGIRMAISSVASEKALYKKALIDWVTSLALVYLLQYIIMFTINANDAIVKALASAAEQLDISEKIMGIALASLGISFESIASTVVYVLFVVQILIFVLKYIKRMLRIAFLIIISPLISITYTIDKMGDGKAQALNSWLKEFVFNVLIQPFHCIIYLAFIGTAFGLIFNGGDSGLDVLKSLVPGLSDNSLGNALLAIMCILFVDDAEKIVKKIFGFDQASSMSADQALTTAAAVGAGFSMYKNAKQNVTALKSAINSAKNSKGYKALTAAKGMLAPTKSGAAAREAFSKANKETRERSKGLTGKIAGLSAGIDAANKTYKGTKAHSKTREGRIESAMEKKLGKHSYAAMKESEKNGTLTGEAKSIYDRAKSEATEEVDKKIARQNKVKNSGAVRTIKGATGMVGKFVKSNLPGATGFIAFAAGLATGNPITGLSMGFAASETTKEMMKTQKTVASNATNTISNPEDYTGEDAKEKMDMHIAEVKELGDANALNNNSSYAEDIKSDLEDSLKTIFGEIDTSQLAKDLERKISQEKNRIANNPNANPADFNLSQIVSDFLRNNGADMSKDKQSVMQSAGAYADFRDNCNLYTQIKNQEAMGGSLDKMSELMCAKIASQYSEASSSSSSSDSSSNSSDGGTSRTLTQDERVEQTIRNIEVSEVTETVINTIDSGDVDRVKQEIDSKITELNNLLNDASSNKDEINSQLSRFQEAQRLIQNRINNRNSDGGTNNE